MCVTFVTCEVRVCGLRCRSGSSLYIYRVYLLTYLQVIATSISVICPLLPPSPCRLRRRVVASEPEARRGAQTQSRWRRSRRRM